MRTFNTFKQPYPNSTPITWGTWHHSPPSLYHPTENTLLMRGQHKATGLHLLRDHPERTAWHQPHMKPDPPPARITKATPPLITGVPGSGPGQLFTEPSPSPSTDIHEAGAQCYLLIFSCLKLSSPHSTTSGHPLPTLCSQAQQQHVTCTHSGRVYALWCPAAWPEGLPPQRTSPGTAPGPDSQVRCCGFPLVADVPGICPGILLW